MYLCCNPHAHPTKRQRFRLTCRAALFTPRVINNQTTSLVCGHIRRSPHFDRSSQTGAHQQPSSQGATLVKKTRTDVCCLPRERWEYANRKQHGAACYRRGV